MKEIINFLTIICIAPLLFSQDNPFYKEYSWEKNPNFSVIAADSISIIGLKDKITYEFVFEDEDFWEYFLEHKAVWLNSDERIEDYNKIYLPYNSTSELLLSKARVIKPNGTIIVLDDSKILTAKDEKTERVYKYFAFEGIEKGSIVEYYYVVKRIPEYRGKQIFFQTSYPKNDVAFDLYAPSNLVFKFKSYNGLPEVIKDTLSEKKSHWTMRSSEIAALEEESQAAYNAYRAFLIFKLDENLSTNSKDLISYSNVSQNLYNYYYGEIDKKVQKKLDKFIKEAGIKPSLDEEEMIRTLETYIKTNVYLEQGGKTTSELENVLDQKVANIQGMTKLFVSLFNSLNIKHEIILTSDRQDIKFDPGFEATNFLNEFLIYFPKTEKYMSPTDFDSRYGFPPAYLTDTYGLNIKEVVLGEFKSGAGKIEYIDPVPAEKTVDKMIINVTFDREDLTKTNIKLERSMEGYYAMYMQPFMNLIPEENKTELLEGFAKNLDENAVILTKKMNNAEPKLFGIKPLEFVLDFESEAFVEKAGNHYLFKVGDLIGAQIQMYQETERKLPLEDEFTRTYYRTINVKIPEGYKVANAEDINIDHSFSKDGKKVLMFKSFYEMDGDTLKITADEFYNINKISKEFYEDYRQVINSAADFNKVTLILEPK
ncbi:MAG TPA: DUF3857 domain-containing protein [Aequorivita sp.]|nr:DUF3857 domain-containing protein [Aequorivita sp.]